MPPATLPEFRDKQHFFNTGYERFFRGHSVKVADTPGIVYTPEASRGYLFFVKICAFSDGQDCRFFRGGQSGNVFTSYSVTRTYVVFLVWPKRKVAKGWQSAA